MLDELPPKVLEAKLKEKERLRLRDSERKRQRRTRALSKDTHEPVYIGVDGEGVGRRPEPGGHRYILLAASTEDGSKKWWIEAPLGEALTTERCLDFLLSISGKGRKIYSYFFNYDLTKLLSDLPDTLLFLLFRPEKRKRAKKYDKLGPWPIQWNGFDINLQGTKFTIARGIGDSRKTVTIWDIGKFYQSKFVAALEDWKVGNEEEKAAISKMKDQRSVFQDEERDAIRKYCLDECKFLGELAHKLVSAHNDAGLELTSFYGAGSSASAMLKKMGIKARLKLPPKEMHHAISSAFFGGRFENGMIGNIEGKVYNFDISSAYPYQLCFLPCLQHGTWRHTHDRKELEGARAACVEYRLNPKSVKNISWGPFPFRDDSGSICFPAKSGGGWVWRDEYLAGEKYFEGVEFVSAWIYECSCECKPFADIPHYYRERCRIGKEGAGIVFKLGPNSCYGKLAQSVGSAPFNSWIWAGIITSGCRAQVLELIALHKDRRNIILIATDGVLTREDVECPIPIDTGTGAPYLDTAKNEWVCKPLGGWERTVGENGVFAARPGIYFPLNPSQKDLKKIRGRGVGKGVIQDNWKKISDAWETRENKLDSDVTIEVRNLERFCGAKSCISFAPGTGRITRASGGKTPEGTDMPDYGQWIKRRVLMSFDPMPKRAGIMKDGRSLKLRVIPLSQKSIPYSKAIKSQERKMLEDFEQEMSEQPDYDLMEVA